MQPRPLTKADWDSVVAVMDAWSGGLSRSLSHPIFFYELGDMARVMTEGDEMIAFLLGFLTPAQPPVGYVHLVGVHPDHRRRGTGRLLYQGFEAEARARGARSVKAITTLGNEGSLRFHRSIGFEAHEVADYAGQGMHRIVFSKAL